MENKPGIKRTSFDRGTKLPIIAGKTFELKDGSIVNGKRILVSFDKIKEKTTKHKENPRNEAGLSVESVSDILPSIRESGVQLEGIAVEIDGVYHLMDASRRRFCCIEAKRDLPLWVIKEEITISDARYIAKKAGMSKPLSYREMGKTYVVIMEENGFKTTDEMAENLGDVTAETVRQRVNAGLIPDNIIDMFPDCESIPTRYYNEIQKLLKILKREEMFVDDFVEEIQEDVKKISGKTKLKQNLILDFIKDKAQSLKGTKSKEVEPPVTTNIKEFESDKVYARKVTNKHTRKVSYNFSRIDQEKIKKIDDFIASVING